MNYSDVLANARECIGKYCKACPVCNGVACKNQIPGPGAKGVGDTAIRNYNKWADIRVNMDTLCENGTPDTHVELFGRSFKYPFFAGPVGAVNLHYSDVYTDMTYNDVLVRACAESGIAAFTGDGTNPDVMTMATKAIGNADGCGVPTIKPWNIDTIKEKMAQAKASGCFAVAMDVDAAGLPFLKNMTPPAGSKSVAELAEIVKLAERPFIVKGVMTVKGALKAKEAGAAAIVVSNHGGRVLDQCPATAEVLPEIAAALKERGHSVTLCDPAKDFERLMDMAREHDAAFINLHGAPGEDGLVQAILDRVNCPYQGAGPAGSFLALHKAAARQIFRDAGLNIPDGVFLPRHPGPNWKPDLQYPMFVKSNTGGSSLHLSRVTNEEELYTALNSLFSMGEEAIVETAVVGREVTCGVLGEEALAPILVVSKGNYFDYHNKYAPDGAQEICPAPIAPEETAKVQDAALRAHHALGLKGYSRADFILQDDGTLYILEVNTTPGMTSTSLVPREAAVKGMSFADLVERLLELALER